MEKGSFPDINYRALDDDSLIGVVSPKVLETQGIAPTPAHLQAADAVLRWLLNHEDCGFTIQLATPEGNAVQEVAYRVAVVNEVTKEGVNG